MDPFINIEGIFNFRDIGGYAIDGLSEYSVRRGFIFRCANTGNITPSGMQQLRELGITTIFDLRSSSEIERTQDFAPITEVPGVRRVHVSLFDGEYPTTQTVESLKKYATDHARVSSSDLSIRLNYGKSDPKKNRSDHMSDFSRTEKTPFEPSLLTSEIIPWKAASSSAMEARIGPASPSPLSWQ